MTTPDPQDEREPDRDDTKSTVTIGEVAVMRYLIWALNNRFRDLMKHRPFAASEAVLIRKLTLEVIGLADLLVQLIAPDFSFGVGDPEFDLDGRWELAASFMWQAVAILHGYEWNQQVFEPLADQLRRSLKERM